MSSMLVKRVAIRGFFIAMQREAFMRCDGVRSWMNRLGTISRAFACDSERSATKSGTIVEFGVSARRCDCSCPIVISVLYDLDVGCSQGTSAQVVSPRNWIAKLCVLYSDTVRGQPSNRSENSAFGQVRAQLVIQEFEYRGAK